MANTILGKLMALQRSSLAELRTQYATLFPGERPPTANKTFLQRCIAYRLQEQAFGGLSEPAQAQLRTLMATHDPINRPAKNPVPPATPEAPRQRPLRDRRLPMPGTVLTKIYKGVRLQVTVLERGFQYGHTVYRSLTAIAKAVTGRHWNGYLFFGL